MFFRLFFIFIFVVMCIGPPRHNLSKSQNSYDRDMDSSVSPRGIIVHNNMQDAGLGSAAHRRFSDTFKHREMMRQMGNKIANAGSGGRGGAYTPKVGTLSSTLPGNINSKVTFNITAPNGVNRPIMRKAQSHSHDSQSKSNIIINEDSELEDEISQLDSVRTGNNYYGDDIHPGSAPQSPKAGAGGNNGNNGNNDDDSQKQANYHLIIGKNNHGNNRPNLATNSHSVGNISSRNRNNNNKGNNNYNGNKNGNNNNNNRNSKGKQGDVNVSTGGV